MTIPVGSNYPTFIDTNDNLFLVHDSLRVQLAEDYNPGDTSIQCMGDPTIMGLFPATGIVTLVEQCSDIEFRATAFYYTTVTPSTFTFSGLEILPGFTDVFHPATVTDVVQMVISKHHNNEKDAIIAVETFVGKKGTTDVRPYGATMEGRINFLRNLVLPPYAWFSASPIIGLVPLTVNFTDLSFRIGTDGTSVAWQWQWDFGDGNNITIDTGTSGNTTHTYTSPGIYNVTLTVTNDFGSNTVEFPMLINARTLAPIPAWIECNPLANQILTIEGMGPQFVVRSPTNTLIQFEVPQGPNPSTPGYSYAGEQLVNNVPIDPVVLYTWDLTDDLLHGNNPSTLASYSIGGLYDMVLRVDTTFGAYRITEYPDAINIVETTNLWLWVFTNNACTLSCPVVANEFGLLSQTFKTAVSTFNVTQDSSFLDTAPNSAQQIREFNRNVGFAPRSTAPSGNGGTTLLFWASGRDVSLPPSSENINFEEYNGFTDSYASHTPISRPWNWVSLSGPSNIYFLFGTVAPPFPPNTSPTNQARTAYNLLSLTATGYNFANQNYSNGAQELQQNVSVYDNMGNSVYGNFSVYRSAWLNNTGYIVRNDGVGPFFRLISFYQTQGNVNDLVNVIQKLPDMPGTTKVEGQLLPLSTGVFFFNNSGAVSAFNVTSQTWQTSAGTNSAGFQLLQDQTVNNYNDPAQTLLAASDEDHNAYLSFDYSPNAFINFNEINTTFTSLGSRPTGSQFFMGVY